MIVMMFNLPSICWLSFRFKPCPKFCNGFPTQFHFVITRCHSLALQRRRHQPFNAKSSRLPFGIVIMAPPRRFRRQLINYIRLSGPHVFAA